MWRVWGRGAQGSGGENLREGDHWGDPDVNGRIVLRWIFRKWKGVVGTGWSWRALVSKVRNLRVPKMRGIS